MSFKQTLYIGFDFDVFDTEEIEDARTLAARTKDSLYCWKTSGNSNWLEKGLSMTDVFGVVVLPQGLPKQIEMPDDVETDE